ncbi:MAG: cereblon family protein [Desulfobacterota bacterium]|nr:cereblon family protein [Thermodesulfobacteriota bacterium]
MLLYSEKSRSALRRDGDYSGALNSKDIVYAETRQEDTWGDERLLCRACGQTITSPRERIDIAGAHRHTFVNPAGIVYEIGCFRNAVGCAFVGPATREWSWFAGYSWKIVVCGACLTHLGWLYLGEGGGSFYGFILSRLTET